MAKLKPCVIKYNGKEYAYDKWIEFLYSGGLDAMVKSGEIKIPALKGKEEKVVATKAKPKQGKYALQRDNREEIQNTIDAVSDILDENPDASLEDIREFLKEYINAISPDTYSEQELDAIIEGAYVDAVNMKAGGLVEPITKRLAQAFLGIKTNFLANSKALAEKAKELQKTGDIKYSVISGEKNFEKWKGDNKLVRGDEVQEIFTGEKVVIECYHGTTNEFYEFDSSVKGNIEGHLGRINYFTTDYQDASQNYLSEGADITGRIDLRQEQLGRILEERYGNRDVNFDTIVNDYNLTEKDVEKLYPSGTPEIINIEEISRFLAERELKGNDEKVLELYVKLNNPVVLGNKASWFSTMNIPESDLEQAAEEIADEYGISVEEAKDDYEWEINDRAIENSGYDKLHIEALSDALSKNGYDNNKVHDILGDDYYELEVDLNKLENKIRGAELYENEYEEMASSQVISDFFKNLGFDGIVLTDVSKRFKGMLLSPSTSHIHVFDEYANQIKLADGSNELYGETKDIRFHLNDKGEILGFSYGGEIYLNSEKLTPKTTIEEAGHIWINWAKNSRPDLYEQGLEKVDKSKYLSEVENSKEYQAAAKEAGLKKGSKEWNKYMREEALAKAIADEGAKFVSQTRKSEFKKWLDSLWDKIAEFFGIRNLSYDEVKGLTLEDFARMAAADVFNPDNGEQKFDKEQSADERLRGHYESVLKQLAKDDKLKGLLEKVKENPLYYQAGSNEKNLQAALDYIKENGIEKSYEYATQDDIDFDNPARQTVVGMFMRNFLHEQWVEAEKAGDSEVAFDLFDKYNTLLAKMAERATVAGQSTQPLSMMLYDDIFATPQNADWYYRRLFEKKNKEARKNKINKNAAKNIVSNTEKAANKAKKDVEAAIESVDEKVSKSRPKKYKLSKNEQQELSDLKGYAKSKLAIFNDITGAANVLTDKKVRRYLYLKLKETAFDLGNFTDAIVSDIGEGAKKNINSLFNAAMDYKQEMDFDAFVAKQDKAAEKLMQTEEQKQAAREANKEKRKENKANRDIQTAKLLSVDTNDDISLSTYALDNGIVLNDDNIEEFRTKVREWQDARRAYENKEKQKAEEREIGKMIKDELKERSLSIKKIANMRIDGKIKTLQELTDKLVSDANLTEDEAEEYAKSIEKVYNKYINDYLVGVVERNAKKANVLRIDLTAKKYKGKDITLSEFIHHLQDEAFAEKADKAKIIVDNKPYIEKVYNDVIKGEKEVEHIDEMNQIESLVDLYNKGLLNEDTALDIFAAKFGIVKYNKNSAKVVFQGVSKISSIKNPIARQVAINNMMSQLQLGSNTTFTDLYNSLWFSSVLSGLTTIDANLSSGFIMNKAFAKEIVIEAIFNAYRLGGKQSFKIFAAQLRAAIFGQEEYKDVLKNLTKDLRYTVAQGSDIFNEDLRGVAMNKLGEINWRTVVDKPKIGHALNVATKLSPRILQGIDLVFGERMMDAITIANLVEMEVKKANDTIKITKAGSVYQLDNNGVITIYNTEKEAKNAKGKLLNDAIDKAIGDFFDQSVAVKTYASDKAIQDRLDVDIDQVVENKNGTDYIVVRDMGKPVKEFDINTPQSEIDDFKKDIAVNNYILGKKVGLNSRYIKYYDFYKSENIPQDVLAKSRDYASVMTFNSTVRGTLGVFYDKYFLHWKKALARKLKQQEDIFKDKNEDAKERVKSVFIYVALQAVDKTLVFMRFTLNAINMFINYTPAGAVRAASGGAIFKKHNLELFDEVQQRRLYYKSIIGSLGGAFTLALMAALKPDDDEEKKTRDLVAEWNKKNPDKPITWTPVIRVPYEGMIVGSMAHLPKNLSDFLKQNLGYKEFSEYKDGRFVPYIQDPTMGLWKTFIGTYFMTHDLLVNNPNVTDKKGRMYKDSDVKIWTTAVMGSTIDMFFKMSNMKGYNDFYKSLSNIVESPDKSFNSAMDRITAPITGVLQPTLVKNIFQYFNPYIMEKYYAADDLGAYVMSKMPLSLNYFIDNDDYILNQFGQKIPYIAGENQGLVANKVRGMVNDYLEDKDFKRGIEINKVLMSKGYTQAKNISENASSYMFKNSDNEWQNISDDKKLYKKMGEFTGQYYFNFLDSNLDDLIKIGSEKEEMYKISDFGFAVPYDKKTDLNKFLDLVWKQCEKAAFLKMLNEGYLEAKMDENNLPVLYKTDKKL